jgi:hypothetical protein
MNKLKKHYEGGILIQKTLEVLELQSIGVTNFKSSTLNNETPEPWRRVDWMPNQRMSCGTKGVGFSCCIELHSKKYQYQESIFLAERKMYPVQTHVATRS